MVAVVIPVVVTIMFAIIALFMFVPIVVVFNPAAVSLPVTLKVLAALVTRRRPPSAAIWRPSPVPVMPLIVVSVRIPIALDPNKVGTGLDWTNAFETRGRWRSNLNANRNLSAKGGQGGQKCRGEQCHHYVTSHVRFNLLHLQHANISPKLDQPLI